MREYDDRQAAGITAGAAVALLSAALFGASTPLAKILVGRADPWMLAALLYLGSGLGLLNPFAIRTIKHRLSVPVIVDAGVGTASDACLTMEQGVDGILMNTGIAAASDPVRMATAMRLAVDAGRLAHLAGRMPRREVAVPSSPIAGMLG